LASGAERAQVKDHSYWLDTVDSTPPQEEPLEPARRADAVVVGAGYTGLSAARHLARAGASVVVVERAHVGGGASSRNGGQVLTGLKLDPETLITRYGESRARELFEISLESVATLERVIAEESIDCDYERTGHIQAAAKPAHFDAFRRERDVLARVFHHDVHLVSAAEQRSELGSDRYFGLLVDERSAAINPARFVSGLASAARRAGAIIVSGTTVLRFARAGSRWTVVTDRGDIDAGDVLIATNGYTNGAAPFLQRRFIPIGSYVVATEPLEAALADRLLPKRRMAFDSKHFLYYFRVTRDRRLLFGGRAEFSRPTAASLARATTILTEASAAIFPEVRGKTIDYAWSGHVAFTRDQMPHAGRIDDMYYAGGYCGHGVAMATYLGGVIARRMAGEPLAHPLVDDRFAAIPLYRGTPWFLPLAGAYYRFRDLID
jgi:glycine/D-amino acid oxidase-like deaminating enzyme